MNKRYDTVIYDLDGTLLNTLDDLAAAANYALAQRGYPPRTTQEVCRFVGNGIGLLIRRAVPPEATDEDCAAALQVFKDYYAQHNNVATAPYEGILPMLDELRKQGVKQAVVSNKNDPNVKSLCSAYFSGWIDLAVGEQPGVARKPCPDSLFKVMQELGAVAESTLYVGDSDVDVITARNAGVDCAAVCWGFRSEEELRAAGATQLFHTPQELCSFIQGK